MNITDVLDELRINYKHAGEHHHVRGSFVGIDCPLCSPGSDSYKLGIPESSRAATCWSCGTQNLAWMLHLSSKQPYSKVADLLRGVVIHTAPAVKHKGRLILPSGLKPLPKLHRKYLQSRHIDPDYAAAVWGVLGTELCPKLSWRLFLPVMLRGKTLSWTTRSVGNDSLRYVSASPEQEAVPRTQLLFGEDHAAHAVLIVEGPLDAIRVGAGAVATMGLKYSQEQVLRLSRFPLRIVCFDNEAPAQRRARQLCELLSAFPGTTKLVQIETGKDPGDANEREVRQLRRMLT